MTFELKKGLTTGRDEVVVSAISGSGKFWDREQSLVTEVVDELVLDYQFSLPQVILSKAGLMTCQAHLEKWLSGPFEFELQLSPSSGPLVMLFLGVREDFISKVDRPVFSLKYSSSRMKSEWCFVADHSCIDLLLQGLKRWASSCA
ncbi:MAG TPA: hypothetical protein VKB02_16365 [Pyrinomonadaceae bacterium]|nr:hypothetical protein [Pyrinomonadaceae bacterium]